jgi:hypothetical protein
MNFHIIYYPLYMLIMHVSHNSDRMPDSSHMPKSGRKRRLQSEDVTLVVCPTPTRRHDSGRTSQLPVAHHGFDHRSYHMSYLLVCERLHMVELDDCSILQTKLECMTHSAFENSASHGFICSRVRPMGCVTWEHLARLDLRET